LRGVLNQEDVGFLRTVIKGLASTATNPLTPEERRRLLELVDKDDLTIEEVEELYMLARKLYEEYIDRPQTPSRRCSTLPQCVDYL
jgi:hypothetical protein